MIATASRANQSGIPAHVLHILDYSAPFKGGIVAQLETLGIALAETGRRLIIAVPEACTWFSDIDSRVETTVLPSIRRPLRSGFPRQLRQVCCDKQVGLVHLHFSFALPFSIACHRWSARVPILYQWHNPPRVLLPSESPGLPSRRGFPAPLARALAFRAARFAGRVITRHIAISDEIAGLLVKNRWADREKILLLPNASPWPVQERASNGPDMPEVIVVGSVANFRPEKDHATLLRGFRSALDADPRLRLKLVGDGETKSAMMEMVSSLRLHDHVEFLGYVSDPREIYRQFDVFVLASHFEGQGLVLLEAMSNGLPVVATDLASIRSTVSDGEDGLLVARQDPKKLGAAILELAHNPQKRKALGDAGRAKVAQRYSGAGWVGRLMSCYRDLGLFGSGDET